MFNKYFINYLFIGIGASSIDVGLFWLFFNILHEGIFFSNAISVSSAALFSFAVNSLYNFKKSDLVFFRFLSFLTVIVVGYFLGTYLILFFVNI